MQVVLHGPLFAAFGKVLFKGLFVLLLVLYVHRYKGFFPGLTLGCTISSPFFSRTAQTIVLLAILTLIVTFIVIPSIFHYNMTIQRHMVFLPWGEDYFYWTCLSSTMKIILFFQSSGLST